MALLFLYALQPMCHFSLVICRINTITFLSAIGSSCTLVYINMHWNAYSLHRSETTSLKYSSAFQAWRMDLGTQDMTLRDRWRCTINKAVHFNVNGGYMFSIIAYSIYEDYSTVYMLDSHSQRYAALIQSVKSETCKSPNMKYLLI